VPAVPAMRAMRASHTCVRVYQLCVRVCVPTGAVQNYIHLGTCHTFRHKLVVLFSGCDPSPPPPSPPD
jgi:hypothetical protein